jgi:hypothetical protein
MAETEIVERVARAIVAELARQDCQDFTLGDDLKLAWLDQGEVDFAIVARKAIEAMGAAINAALSDTRDKG